MKDMIGRRVVWEWRGVSRAGVVKSVVGDGEHAVYLVAADDGGQAVVPCTVAYLSY